MNNRSRRLAALEDLLTQREQQAEVDDMPAIAEAVRARIDRYLRGEKPLPDGSVKHDSPAHRRLQARFTKINERFKAHGIVRKRTP